MRGRTRGARLAVMPSHSLSSDGPRAAPIQAAVRALTSARRCRAGRRFGTVPRGAGACSKHFWGVDLDARSIAGAARRVQSPRRVEQGGSSRARRRAGRSRPRGLGHAHSGGGSLSRRATPSSLATARSSAGAPPGDAPPSSGGNLRARRPWRRGAERRKRGPTHTTTFALKSSGARTPSSACWRRRRARIEAPIRHRFSGPQSFEEIGRSLGMTPSA
jgi:hypothetical protein